ncbi:MAG TPA: hypothetical protein PKB12_09230, partial [Elusimicrobiota bacterium]|nr:hypothetical protein [Elusimicrobiota bacterium]
MINKDPGHGDLAILGRQLNSNSIGNTGPGFFFLCQAHRFPDLLEETVLKRGGLDHDFLAVVEVDADRVS